MAFEGLIEGAIGVFSDGVESPRLFDSFEDLFSPEVADEFWVSLEFDSIKAVLDFLLNSRLDIVGVTIIALAGGGFLLILRIRSKEPATN